MKGLENKKSPMPVRGVGVVLENTVGVKFLSWDAFTELLFLFR